MITDAGRVVMAFVRGESSWRSLTELGLKVELPTEVRVMIPPDFPVIQPRVIDVAAGLISHTDNAARQEWAAILLGLDIDLSNLELEEHGPALLEAVWDASSGSISDESLAFARGLLAGPQRQH